MKNTKMQFHNMLNLWSLKELCVIIDKTSKIAILEIPEEIDFLHLDGDYSEVVSLEDVQLYLPKVKAGGYILISNLYTSVFGQYTKEKGVFAFI